MRSTKPKPFVFVLMPFKNEFDDVFGLGIKPACQEAGAYCERVDEQIFTESILDRIYNQIAKADIIVADMTDQNPNVFYETGYAHALGKRTIVMTQNAGDIPFDLKHAPHILYGNSITVLRKELKKRVKHFIDHPEKKSVENPESLEFRINGANIKISPTIFLAIRDHDPLSGWIVRFDVHNPTTRVMDVMGMDFGLVFPVALGKPLNPSQQVAQIDEEHYMAMFPAFHPMRLLPQGWIQNSIQIFSSDAKLIRGTLSAGDGSSGHPQVHNCAVRIYTEIRMKEFRFATWVK
jgi:hypothetical protein